MIDQNRLFTIFQQMSSIGSDSPMAALIKMQTRKGIDESTAEQNARWCMAAVAGREALFEELSEDTMAPLNRLFEKLAKMDAGKRLEILHRFHFGLLLVSDPGFSPDSADAQTLYRQYLARQAGARCTPEMLEEAIRQALQQYRISPAAMRMLAGKLRSPDDAMATAMALGEGGRNLKCLMTMEHWLDHNSTVSMEESANAACASADYQAVADAVSKGYITRKYARILLCIIGIVVFLYSIDTIVFGFDDLRKALEKYATGAVPQYIHHDWSASLSAGDHLRFALENFFGGILGILFSDVLMSKKTGDLIGSAASWLSGKLQSAKKGAFAMALLADDLESESRPAQTRTAQASPCFLAEEEEDEDPAQTLF